MMEKVFKPNAEWTITSLIYDPDDIRKALGIKLKKGEWVYIYSDGTNKVTVNIRRKP